MTTKNSKQAWVKPEIGKLGRLGDVAGSNVGTTQSGGCGSGGGSCHS